MPANKRKNSGSATKSKNIAFNEMEDSSPSNDSNSKRRKNEKVASSPRKVNKGKKKKESSKTTTAQFNEDGNEVVFEVNELENNEFLSEEEGVEGTGRQKTFEE